MWGYMHKSIIILRCTSLKILYWYKISIFLKKRRRKQTSVALVVEDNAPSKCNICHMNFVDSEALIRHHRNKHMALHASRFVCQFCNCLYTDKSTLNRHIKSKHEAPEAKHECKDCKKSFTRLSDLRRHDRTMHGSGQVHECFFCGDTFTRADACRRHEREQHEYGKEVACSTCLTPFTRVNNMINHKHCGKEIIIVWYPLIKVFLSLKFTTELVICNYFPITTAVHSALTNCSTCVKNNQPSKLTLCNNDINRLDSSQLKSLKV